MKKIYYLTFSTIILSLTLVVPSVFSTVGGPTYNTTDQSIYYIETNSSGRGCPPMLMKISVTTEILDVMHSCEEGEAYITNSNNDYGVVLPALYKVTSGYSDLKTVNLNTNGIEIDVSLVDFVTIPEIDYIMKANFSASVYQNGVKISVIPLTGCNTKQPFVFSAYSIPGYTDRIALVTSTKGDCMEGGYTNETISIVSGVSNIVDISNYIKKENSALVPSEDTLVVYEADTIKKSVISEPKQGNMNTTSIIVISVLIGIVLGMAIIRSSKNS
jgi:hypothetical protein